MDTKVAPKRLYFHAMVGRFAPSPSGFMHLGHASTYLLAWLQVRTQNGTLLLRMEDVDRQRCKPEFADAWRRDLTWLGLHWDREVPAQSERSAAYAAALETLAAQDLVFACSCTRKDMEEAVRAPHEAWGAYPGTCVNAGLPLDGPYAKRLKYPDDAFVLQRADGAWGYQLAVVVDDGAQGVTHVLRGLDLADSEAPQRFLHHALGQPAPEVQHAPLWYGPDGHRLSKRHGSVALQDFREKGWTPEKLWGQVGQVLGLQEDARDARPQDFLEAFQRHPLRTAPIHPSEGLPLWA
jgi:glutamyl-tRNA synthetase